MLHINIVGVVTCIDNSTRRLVTCSLSLDLFKKFILLSRYTVPLLQRQHHNTRKKLKLNKMLSILVMSCNFMSVIFSAPCTRLLRAAAVSGCCVYRVSIKIAVSQSQYVLVSPALYNVVTFSEVKTTFIHYTLNYTLNFTSFFSFLTAFIVFRYFGIFSVHGRLQNVR